MKKIIWLIVGVAVVVLAYFGWNYYQETYQGHTAYAVVSSKVPTREKTVDDNGKTISNSYSYVYHFKFVRTDGKVQNMEYELMGSDPKPFTPNSYVKAKISQKRVINGPNEVKADQVPSDVKAKLNN
ncbi:DUF1093 domain-containing protein [Lentilactobacillus senioris]|nr:DUF1093 domain-containing protein [Lentilactobacillus senioris]